VQRIDRQLAARRTKLMKELRERIAEVERRVAQFNSGRAALWRQVETAFCARMERISRGVLMIGCSSGKPLIMQGTTGMRCGENLQIRLPKTTRQR
jgi:hypothetical protein